MRIRSHSELMTEMDLFRTTVEVKKLCFASFDDMATFILTRTVETAFPHLKFLLSVILVLPFVTADCERLFSKLGYSTSKLLIEIDWVKFSTSFFSFTTPLKKKKQNLDIKKLAEKLANSWKKDKTDKMTWSKSYDMCIV